MEGRTADSYNAAAFVNLGNCWYQKGDIEKAKEMFQVIFLIYMQFI
jgi:hypothetical protein